MALTTVNMGLTAWDQPSDPFDYQALANNWTAVDGHNHIPGKGVRIPTDGIANSAIANIKIADGAVGDSKIASNAAIAESKLALTPGQLWQPGDVKQTTRSIAPTGWIQAIGLTLLRSNYAALWTVAQAEISAGNAIYGVGDGSTTFTVADLSRRVLIGAGSAGGLSTRALGAGGGAEAHTLSTNELAAHNHAASQSSHSHSASQSSHSHTFIDDNGNYAAIKHIGGGNASPSGRNVASGAGFNGGDLRTNAVQPSVSISSTQPSVSVSNQGGGQSHNNMQPFVTVHILIKI